MFEPDFSFEGVDEKDCFYIQDGEAVLDEVELAKETKQFGSFTFTAKDADGNDYSFECLAFVTMKRHDRNRLYFAVKDLDEQKNCWHGAYIVKNQDGECVLVQETDGELHERLAEILESGENSAEAPSVEKKKGKGWKIALTIILIPFWLLWQFIKALLSLFNIATGDDGFVQGFKRGFNGEDSPMQEYTFINDMGCEQTVYSSDGRNFYGSDGSFAGTSDDGGKTIK